MALTIACAQDFLTSKELAAIRCTSKWLHSDLEGVFRFTLIQEMGLYPHYTLHTLTRALHSMAWVRCHSITFDENCRFFQDKPAATQADIVEFVKADLISKINAAKLEIDKIIGKRRRMLGAFYVLSSGGLPSLMEVINATLTDLPESTTLENIGMHYLILTAKIKWCMTKRTIRSLEHIRRLTMTP
jgi:hypothetical protein